MDNLPPYMDNLATEYGNLGLTVVPVSVTMGRARFAKNLARVAKNLADLEPIGAAPAVPVLGGLWDFSLVGAVEDRPLQGHIVCVCVVLCWVGLYRELKTGVKNNSPYEGGPVIFRGDFK